MITITYVYQYIRGKATKMPKKRMLKEIDGDEMQ